MKKLFIFTALLLVTSCTNYSEDAYRRKVGMWIGASESELIHDWGVPDKTYTSGPRKYLAYDNIQTTYIDDSPRYYGGLGRGFGHHHGSYIGTGIGFGSGYNTRTLVRNCETTFVIQRRVVKEVTYKGNNCFAPEVK